MFTLEVKVLEIFALATSIFSPNEGLWYSKHRQQMYDGNINPPWLSSHIITLSQFNISNSFPRGDVYFFV